MNKRSEAVKKWRRTTKTRMVKSFNCRCAVCGEKYPDEVFDFHHLDPSIKQFSLAKIRGNCIGWKRIVDELRKCIMVCANCHRLIHYSNLIIPENPIRFDEGFYEYKELRKKTKICPICGDNMFESQITCSLSCSAKKSRTVNWDIIDVVTLYNKCGNYAEIGRSLGVSGAAVRKRYLKLTS